jgi:hypothetical protein
MYKFCIVLFFIFLLINCKTILKNDIHPIQIIENYNGNIKLAIEEKILSAPDIIIDLLNKMDEVDIYSSYMLNKEETRLFLDYYSLLPVKFRTLIEEKVIGIYFINNFLGGGMTMPVFTDNRNMYMALFFNPEILRQNISDWIMFRDNSTFSDNESSISIIVECSSSYYALIHTLFHEVSHVYDFYNKMTPSGFETTITPTDFVKNIWKSYNEPIEEYNFMNRNKLSFYVLGDKIDNIYSIDIFTALFNTPFISLYSSISWMEDFAETITWYYLNKHLGINYITNLIVDDMQVLSYNPYENELVNSRFVMFKNME